MPGLDVVRSGLKNYFHRIQSQVHELMEPLSTEELWTRPYPYGNSIGNLLLHLTGNLNYYIGAQIAGTNYARHRDLEFSGSGRRKDELLTEFDQAIEIVLTTVEHQSDDDWGAPYSAVGTENRDRFSMVLNCAAHAHHHFGQMIYLQRELLERRRT